MFKRKKDEVKLAQIRTAVDRLIRHAMVDLDDYRASFGEQMQGLQTVCNDFEARLFDVHELVKKVISAETIEDAKAIADSFTSGQQ